MTHFIKHIRFLFLASFFLAACSGTKTEEAQTSQSNEAEILLQYLEENGDIINDAAIPYFIDADEIFNNQNGSNYLLIDVRLPRDYNRGHIANAVNVLPENIIDYFENSIEPNSFKKIVIVCNNAHLSGYVAAILRMLGYNNIFNLRFGMSSWHESIARRHWFANLSDDLIGNLETAPHAKNAPGQLPSLQTGETNGYSILRARAQKALEINWDEISIDYLDVLEQTENFYVINYVSETLYNQGHLPGAIQYTPKKAIRSSEDILTLPIDRPLVFYCFTGHHSVYVNAFLAIMGYQIRSLEYGMNGFMHQTMVTTQPASRSFSDNHIKNYPLSTEGLRQMSTDRATPSEKVEVETAQGGC